MGLFDEIVIPKSRLLGIDEKIDKYLSLIKTEEVRLQTKDFDQTLSTYFIKDDSLIYEKKNFEWGENESLFGGYMKTVSTEMIPHNITTTIVCYDYLQTDLLDVSIDFKIVFINGKVDKISLQDYEAKDPSPRIKRDKELAEKHQKYLKFSKTFLGKTQRKLGKILYKISKVFLSVGHFIQQLSFKL